MGTIQCVTVFVSCCVVLHGNVTACHEIKTEKNKSLTFRPPRPYFFTRPQPEAQEFLP